MLKENEKRLSRTESAGGIGKNALALVKYVHEMTLNPRNGAIKDDGRYIFDSAKEFAHKIGCTERTVTNVVKRLKEQQFIYVRNIPYGGILRRNGIVLNYPKLIAFINSDLAQTLVDSANKNFRIDHETDGNFRTVTPLYFSKPSLGESNKKFPNQLKDNQVIHLLHPSDVYYFLMDGIRLHFRRNKPATLGKKKLPSLTNQREQYIAALMKRHAMNTLEKWKEYLDWYLALKPPYQHDLFDDFLKFDTYMRFKKHQESSCPPNDDDTPSGKDFHVKHVFQVLKEDEFKDIKRPKRYDTKFFARITALIRKLGIDSAAKLRDYLRRILRETQKHYWMAQYLSLDWVIQISTFKRFVEQTSSSVISCIKTAEKAVQDALTHAQSTCESTTAKQIRELIIKDPSIGATHYNTWFTEVSISPDGTTLLTSSKFHIDRIVQRFGHLLKKKGILNISGTPL